MANDLVVPASLEQAQVLALKTDINVQARRDNVLLYVTSVERNLISASEELEKMLPQLKKAVDDAAIAYAEAKYANYPKALAKLGINGVKVKAEHTADDGVHKIAMSFVQEGENRYESNLLWLGTKKSRKIIEVGESPALKAASAKHKELSKALADAQQQSLRIKVELQNVSRHEREGMANVIEKERQDTPEGRRLVEEIKAGAEARCAGLLKDIAAITSGVKQLTGKK